LNRKLTDPERNALLQQLRPLLLKNTDGGKDDEVCNDLP